MEKKVLYQWEFFLIAMLGFFLLCLDCHLIRLYRLRLGREGCWTKWSDKLNMCAFQMRRISEILDNFLPEFPN